MKIILLVVGKTTQPQLADLIDDYAKRLQHYVSFELKTIPELKNAKNMSQEQQKVKEGQLILQNVAADHFMVLLDERGKQYRSVDFAQRLQQHFNNGRNLTFVVGGPYGFSKEVYERANDLLSLSTMTFSHQMVRLFFIEQLYRAMTIINSEPYHHE